MQFEKRYTQKIDGGSHHHYFFLILFMYLYLSKKFINGEVINPSFTR